MDTVLTIIAGVLLIAGFLGCILPIIPGVPLSYAGILILHFTDKVQFSTEFLVIWGIIVIAVQVLDYYIPVWGTKRFGGSRWGTAGSAAGIIVGLFVGSWGIILGPFVGAVIGELLSGHAGRDALRAGFGSFVGFLIGTIAKLIIAGLLIYYYAEALLKI